jgi:hypothetical protein
MYRKHAVFVERRNGIRVCFKNKLNDLQWSIHCRNVKRQYTTGYILDLKSTGVLADEELDCLQGYATVTTGRAGKRPCLFGVCSP